MYDLPIHLSYSQKIKRHRLPASPKSNFMTNFHRPMIHLDAAETGSLILVEKESYRVEAVDFRQSTAKSKIIMAVTVDCRARVVVKALT